MEAVLLNKICHQRTAGTHARLVYKAATGKTYLAEFALPNFFFHVTTACAILRAAGVTLGKFNFLQPLGPPNISAGA